MKALLFALLQYLVPQHLLSRLAGKLASTGFAPIKNTFIGWFVRRYQVNMTEALEENPQAYACFNDFFTRALKPGVRPITQASNAIACPADGTVNQVGKIDGDRLLQAKGHYYTTVELLGGDAALAAEFDGGDFATVYLSPRDYHRVHMPLGGQLRQMTVIPGDLFSVNDATARTVPRLFSRNERAVSVFDTEAGPMAVVLVGAMIVAGIETVWAGEVAPFKRRITTTRYQNTTLTLATGEEMGRFKLGSTVVVLFAKNKVRWAEKFEAGSPTRMGEGLGQML